jgi:hypothetical protein
MYVDPDAARAEYRRRFDIHEAQLIDICHRRAARLITVTIDQPLDVALLELISHTGSISAAAGLAKRKSITQQLRPQRTAFSQGEGR